MILERIEAFGHENIQCSHETTIEITRDNYLTKKGNCILGINANKACKDLNPALRDSIHSSKKIRVKIITDNALDEFYGYGHPDLTLSNHSDIVFRKSNYLSDRTVLINCSKASADLNPDLINELKDPTIKFSIIFIWEQK